MYVSCKSLLENLNPRTIAKCVEAPHNDARVSFHLETNSVRNAREFEDTLTAYFCHHHSRCVAVGGALSRAAALESAKRLLEREYQRGGGDLVTAYNDAHDGTNGGLRAILDKICEGLKAEAVELFVRDAFDRHVEFNSWDQKVELIRQFIAQCGVPLGLSIRKEQPEAYARDYEALIRAYVEGLRQTEALFRRL